MFCPFISDWYPVRSAKVIGKFKFLDPNWLTNFQPSSKAYVMQFRSGSWIRKIMKICFFFWYNSFYNLYGIIFLEVLLLNLTFWYFEF